ncbi:uncharacterized protein LOC128250507 [Octopus bimaculoides]|uniref:uncharacterized protein LOC128250507 n=1 Tax=Octopus bimaculoides TaxID=37653 RepID=UPI0022E1D8CD|nr:uncharacterized protein LOC128250507 [Octopus bimaculoides]
MARSTTASKMVSTSEPLSESSSSIESTEDAATQMSDPHSSSRRSRIISQSSSKFRRNSDVVFCKKTRNASKKFSIESAQGGTKSVVGLPKRSTAMSHSMSQDTKKKDPIPTFIKTSPNRKKLEALQQEIEFLKETFNRRISRHNPKFENAEINDSKAENLQPLTHHFSSTTSTDNPPNPYIPTQINKSAKYPPRHPVINSNASSNHQTTTFFTDDPKLNLAKYNIERNSQMSSSPDHSGTTGVYQIKPQQPKTMMRTMMTPAPNLVNTPYYTPNRIYHGIYKERQPPPRVQAISCNKSSQFQQSIDHYNDGTQPLTNHRSSSRFATPMMDSFKENIQYGSAHWNQQVEPKYIAAQRSGGEMSSFITKPYSSAIIEDKYDYGTAPLMQSNRNNAFYASQDEPDVGTMYSLDDCCKVTKCIHHGHMCSAAPIYRKADMNSQIFWGGATDPRNCQLKLLLSDIPELGHGLNLKLLHYQMVLMF